MRSEEEVKKKYWELVHKYVRTRDDNLLDAILALAWVWMV